MSLVELGSTAVLDAKNLQVGQIITLDDDHVVIVTGIEGERIYTRPLIGFEYAWFRWKYFIIFCGLAGAYVIYMILGILITLWKG